MIKCAQTKKDPKTKLITYQPKNVSTKKGLKWNSKLCKSLETVNRSTYDKCKKGLLAKDSASCALV